MAIGARGVHRWGFVVFALIFAGAIAVTLRNPARLREAPLAVRVAAAAGLMGVIRGCWIYGSGDASLRDAVLEALGVAVLLWVFLYVLSRFVDRRTER